MKDSKTSRRQSNIELLRIVSMFLILFLHSNYTAFGPPDANDSLAVIVFRTLSETLCIVGVNVFVIISGWFGIKPNVKGIASFLFQVCFFSLIAILLSTLLASISIKSILKNLYIGSPYWFVISYLGLYVLSPVLNSFIEHSTSTMQVKVITCFFVFQMIYGWVFDIEGFRSGYSLLSFCELYIIARHLRLNNYKIKQLGATNNILLYIIMAVIPAFVLSTLTVTGSSYLESVQSKLLSYNSPLVICGSVFLFLAFTKFRVQSRVINFIASSCFAVYLLHANEFTLPLFTYYLSRIVEVFKSVPSPIVISLFVLLVFFIGILIDLIRKQTWKGIYSAFNISID